MQQSLDMMKTALRVLAAITERRHPNPTDLETLRDYAPCLGKLGPDELACDVIQQAIRKRSRVRDHSGS